MVLSWSFIRKMWTSIIQLHFAATFLDPTLREFRFCPIVKDRELFHQQAINCICLFANNQLLPLPAASVTLIRALALTVELNPTASYSLQDRPPLMLSTLPIEHQPIMFRPCYSEKSSAPGYLCTFPRWSRASAGESFDSHSRSNSQSILSDADIIDFCGIVD